MDIFDLEQEIMKAWNVVEDLKDGLYIFFTAWQHFIPKINETIFFSEWQLSIRCALSDSGNALKM
jgi:hypothetical protein